MCEYLAGDVTNNYLIIFRKWPPPPGVGGRLVIFILYLCVRKGKKRRVESWSFDLNVKRCQLFTNLSRKKRSEIKNKTHFIGIT